mmetsp:Transcript_10626/g.24165  ORF Transcript_10626/g.24165 Transcript_10626/m.24165 type:complete len:510 (+) Transcript_10626:53-1582(+)
MGNLMCAQEEGQAVPGHSTRDEIRDVRSCVVTSNTARKFHFEGDGASASSKQGASGREPSSPHSLDSGRKGECIIFLEKVRNVPHMGASGGLCQAGTPAPAAKPYVRVWAELENGRTKPIGKVAEWKARSNWHGEPCWYSAKTLGFELAEIKHAVLHIDLYDKNELIGSLKEKLEDLPIHKEVIRKLETGREESTQPCMVSFQVLDSDAVLRPRTVFFIRHGESGWNKAQSDWDLWTMAIQKDHPLSGRGREQAEELSARLSEGSKEVEPILHSDVVYVSPLTRAVQTAVIAFSQEFLKSRGHCEFVLMPNAREKQNLGGRDSMPSKIGADIVQHAHDELRRLYQDQDASVLKTFNQLVFDCQEVQDQWWHETHVESHMDLEERLQEFMSQLVYSPHRNIVVVGHSHFFRAVFQKHLSKEFQDKKPSFARQLATMKMSNCGIARLEIDPRHDDEGVITDVELLLNTRIGGEGLNFYCCTQPRADSMEASRVEIESRQANDRKAYSEVNY